MTPAPLLTPWRHIWQLRRQGCDAQAWQLLDQQLPAPLAGSDGARREQRLLIDAFVREGLERLGLAGVTKRLQEQQRLHGLAEDADALEQLLCQGRFSQDMATIVGALIQLRVLRGPGFASELALDLAEGLALLGHQADALALCRQSLGGLKGEACARGHGLAALLTYRQGDRAGCFRHLYDAVALGSEDPITLQFLCRLQCERGDLDAAAITLARISEQDIPEFAARRERLALGLALSSGNPAPDLLERLCAGLGGGSFEDAAELLARAPRLLTQEAEVLQLRDALLRQRQRQALAPGQSDLVKPAGWVAAGSETRRIGILAPTFAAGSAGGLVQALGPWLADEGLTLHWFSSLRNTASDATPGPDALPNGWSLAGMDTKAAAALVQSQELDVLIDLCGWSDGHRHDLLQQRVAPLQLGWFAHDFSTGLPQVDHLLVDRFQVPPLREALVEGLLVLPGSFLALGAPPPPLPLQPSPEGLLAVVAPACHLSPVVLDAWAELLNEHPQRQLVLLDRSFQQTIVWDGLTSGMEERGVAAERLVRRGSAGEPVPTALVLDPLPWGHWWGALSALALGVPVVTCTGTALYQRRTAGVLDLLGLSSFVAKDGEGYVAIADALLSDSSLQQELIVALPQQLNASLLLQPAEFGAALRETLTTPCRG